VLESQCLRPYKYVQMGSRFCLFHAAANVRSGPALVPKMTSVAASILEVGNVLAARSLREARPSCPSSCLVLRVLVLPFIWT
jgi:hypothetical protein